ncbi:NfeD family protein [Roseinatronobacter thiooxidans]|nr:nodulation protein NfeD [Roseinatronobacter thiooxidans]
MRRLWRIGSALVFCLGLVGLALHAQNDDRVGQAVVLELKGAVSPASADYLIRGIETAAANGAGLVIVQMDTPGGLVTSTREINSAILNSSVPVATFVAPSGARAASAGTFILYASHLAVMAPGTSVGAATPVSLGGGGGGLPFGDDPTDENDTGSDEGSGDEGNNDTDSAPADAGMAKAMNDAIAQIRSLAEIHGRNADWGERAVRDAATLTASAAVEENVADFTARNLTELLDRAHGRTVQLDGDDFVLDTEELSLVSIAPDWRTQLLSIIANPNVSLLLMVLGFYGIVFELLNPGALVPGTIGGISLILGMFALSILPFNIAGLALIGLGLLLVLAEAFSPSFGILGIGGTVAIVAGGVFLFDSEVPGFEPSIPALAAVAVASLAFSAIVARLGYVSHRRKVTTGVHDLLNTTARVQDWHGTKGHVFVHGERWNARAHQTFTKDDDVIITKIEGLTLHVAPKPSATQSQTGNA